MCVGSAKKGVEVTKKATNAVVGPVIASGKEATELTASVRYTVEHILYDTLYCRPQLNATSAATSCLQLQ
jgi:hypothetical protein